MRVDGFLSPVSEFDWPVIKHNIIEIEQCMGMKNPFSKAFSNDRNRSSLMRFVFQMARVKHMVKKQATIKEETKKRRARFPSIAQDKKRYKAAKKKTAARRTTRKNWRVMMTQEPKIVAEVEPEIQLDVETQAEPPQPTPREELVATLHPLAPDMPTGEELLSGWTNVVQGGVSTPSIVTAVTPIMVMAGEMHQLINTPGVQVTTIPVTIPVTSAAEMAPFTIQSQLWLEGHQPKIYDEERVVEMELDVEQEDSQEEKEKESQGKEPSKRD